MGETKEALTFSGHETFPFRLNWPRKAVEVVARQPRVFGAADAIIQFGVGRNMVRSIRHWGLALDLIEEADTGRGQYQPTTWGRFFFSTDLAFERESPGYDPFLEYAGTLWWFQWRLGRNRRRATTWYYAFNHWPHPEFSREGLVDGVTEWLRSLGMAPPARESLTRDVDCFIRTYWASRRHTPEDGLECPLVALNFLREVDERHYRFNRGEHPSLPDSVFAASICEFMDSSSEGRAAVTVESLAYGEGSPGRIFLLDEQGLAERLYRLEDVTEGALVYDATAGIRQVLRREHRWTPQALLQRYFEGVSRELSGPLS